MTELAKNKAEEQKTLDAATTLEVNKLFDTYLRENNNKLTVSFLKHVMVMEPINIQGMNWAKLFSQWYNVVSYFSDRVPTELFGAQFKKFKKTIGNEKALFLLKGTIFKFVFSSLLDTEKLRITAILVHGKDVFRGALPLRVEPAVMDTFYNNEKVQVLRKSEYHRFIQTFNSTDLKKCLEYDGFFIFNYFSV